MNDEKLLTVAISHFAIGGLFLLLECIFLMGAVPFFEIWTILAYGILLIVGGVLSLKLRSRIAAIAEVVLCLALFALSPITSAVSVFSAVAIILAIVNAVFIFLYHAKNTAAPVTFEAAGSGEESALATDSTTTENGAEVTAEAEISAESSEEAESKDLESSIVEATESEIADEEADKEFADYDPNDFELELYNNGKTSNSEEIKIVVSPYGVTLSDYSDTSFGDNEAHSYVLDEVNTAKFLECLKVGENKRVATVMNKFSGKDGVSKFKEFCKASNIEFNSYVG